MSDRDTFRLLVAWAASWVVAVGGAAGQQPDPVALLRGVHQSRVGLSGNLRMTAAITIPSRPRNDPVEIEARFDRDRRLFIERRTVLMISPPDQEEKQRRFTALNYDIAAAGRAGIGRVVRVRFRAAFDGNQLCHYSDEDGWAYVVNHQGGAGYNCFDVRILGISQNLNVSRTFEGCFGFGKKNTVTLVGRDEIEGHTVWHVKVAYPVLDYHFWIEDTDGFRVHRYEYRWPADGSKRHVVVRSEYGTGRWRPPLPTRVVVEEKEGGKLTMTKTIDVTEADYDAKPAPALFGYAGLDLAPGTQVVDQRIHRSIGYWNGSGLSETREDAYQLAAQQIAAEVKPGTPRWVIPVAVGAALVLVGAIIGYRRLARRPAAA